MHISNDVIIFLSFIHTVLDFLFFKFGERAHNDSENKIEDEVGPKGYHKDIEDYGQLFLPTISEILHLGGPSFESECLKYSHNGDQDIVEVDSVVLNHFISPGIFSHETSIKDQAVLVLFIMDWSSTESTLIALGFRSFNIAAYHVRLRWINFPNTIHWDFSKPASIVQNSIKGLYANNSKHNEEK
jgi:hypothetical protein